MGQMMDVPRVPGRLDSNCEHTRALKGKLGQRLPGQTGLGWGFDMRVFEGLIHLGILLGLLANLLPRDGRFRFLRLLPAATALFFIVHLVAEGYRWQMIPAYVLAAITVMIMLRSQARPAGSQTKPPSWVRRIVVLAGTVLGLLVLALGGALSVILPVFRLPDPTGPYAVGTQYLYLADGDRPDESTTDPDDVRQVSVQVWYPATLSGDEKAIRYMPRDAARALANFWDLPEFLFDHLALVRTHAYLGARSEKSGAPYPIITYSTSGLMSSHMTLFEELASHGYVVACIGHPYWNSFVYDSAGEVIPFDGQNDQYEAWWDEANSAATKTATSLVSQARTPALKESASIRLNERTPLAVADLKRWSADIGFVLDQLEVMSQGSDVLAGSLDLARVGAMGFSKGGAAAGQFCATDERCRAGVNLTGFMYGDIVDANLQTPFFFISEEELWCRNCFVNDLFFTRAEQDAFQMKIRGARHSNFGDTMLYGWLFQKMGPEPAIEAGRMIQIQNTFSLAFYDLYLKGEDSALLHDMAADYPEVVFSSNLADR
jgi:predicted dienelactone hydrolase